MASRPIWRGHLRLALVSCPVALYSANHDRGALKFNMINPETGSRIKMVTLDAETDQEGSPLQPDRCDRVPATIPPPWESAAATIGSALGASPTKGLNGPAQQRFQVLP